MRKVYILLALSLLSFTGFAQVNNGLMTTLSAVAGMRDRMPIEKLYLQLDKPYYAIGDTLRFKAYLLNGDFLKPSKKSGLLYVELADALNKVVKRITIRLASGVGIGDIALAGKNIPQGAYTLRAYSNWMKNFGDDFVFKKSLYISSVNGSTMLVNANFKLEDGSDKDRITANIRFIGLNGSPKQQRDMQLWVKQQDKTIYKFKANTGTDGTVRLVFDIAAKSSVKNLIIQAQDITVGADTAALTIPVTINRPENTDLQYLPEGGNMVAGIPIKIGFKAINDDGKGIGISGKIINSKQQEVAAFQSTHKGMGSFELVPQAGESYTAKVSLPGNISKSYALPTVNPTGTALRVNSVSKDQLEVTINTTSDIINTTGIYYLIGQTRGMVCYSSAISFKGSVIKKMIATDLFPTGIAHFTLLNSANQPLNERIVYIDHYDNLQLSVTTGKPGYSLRDSIGLTLQVKNKDGKPLRGNFSVAVTDDSQVNIDSLSNNILTSLLLTSDLKGTVEEPGWYFEKDNNPDSYRDNSNNKAIALDNLMLTQGWVGYDWKQVFGLPLTPEYEAESDFKVKGRVSNLINGSVNNTELYLVSTKPELWKTTKTDKNGRFTFSDFPPLDTINFRVQTTRTFNVGITVDEFIPPELTLPKDMPMPWYVNSDSTRLNYANKKQAALDETFDAGKSKLLNEVEINSSKIYRPDPPYVSLNEEEIRNARPGKKPLNLFDLLNQTDNIGRMNLRLIIDGKMYKSSTKAGGPAKTGEVVAFLEEFKTEDIKAFSARKLVLEEGAKKIDRVYLQISVTTNINLGMDHFTPSESAIPAGSYVYRPMPISWPHKFYSPRYTVASPFTGKDRRSTIFWEPNLITDATGKASLSFYSADLPGTYTVIMEGTDMNGNFGYSRQKIKVVKK